MRAREMFNELHFYEVIGEYIDDSKCYIKTIGKEYWGAEPNKLYYVLRILRVEENNI